MDHGCAKCGKPVDDYENYCGRCEEALEDAREYLAELTAARREFWEDRQYA